MLTTCGSICYGARMDLEPPTIIIITITLDSDLIHHDLFSVIWVMNHFQNIIFQFKWNFTLLSEHQISEHVYPPITLILRVKGLTRGMKHLGVGIENQNSREWNQLSNGGWRTGQHGSKKTKDRNRRKI